MELWAELPRSSQVSRIATSSAFLGLDDPARERALARGRPCDMNSVCRGSIVSRTRRTLTAFGVSAGILAAGPVRLSYSSCWTRVLAKGATSALGERASAARV